MIEIINVKPLDNYELLLEFNNGEKKIKDMKPYLNKGIFSKLKDEKVFNSVRISYGTICWNNEIDLDAQKLYETSEKLNK